MSTLEGAAASDHFLQIYPRLSQDTAPHCTLQVSAEDTAATVIQNAVATLGLDASQVYSLLELRESRGEERMLEAGERPAEHVLLWPPEAQKEHPQSQGYYFILQQQAQGGEPSGQDYDDLCNLPTLTEAEILEALRHRFYKHKIYTYASGILIAVNPNKFLPVYYNPKYVKMYENQPLGKLSPHIFAVADVAYRAMLNKQVNQCIVISGESGSGKTESSSYLIHCLAALSQKRYTSGVERTILGAGPVLEAFGNARTAGNNNSSRFGKFIQLNYLESGVIRGAVVEKYLLEKSRLVSRDSSERNYHVFYYLLVGASKEEQKEFLLLPPQDYFYLKQENFHLEDEEKLRHEYKRLHQAMEMVGFLASTKTEIFSILSAILYLGNVTFTPSEDAQVLEVGPAEVLSTLSNLLKVNKELVVETLTQRRAVFDDDIVMSSYTLNEATTVRDSMAKSLYAALFDWIVLHINHALLNKRDMEESISCLSIGILDMFGFENLQTNSFEQLCINYANEKLRYYTNQHIFKLEQEEYMAEGITWQTIDYTDNLGCIQLISKQPTGLFHLLDEESNLCEATDGTLLDKMKLQHQDNPFFVLTTATEPAFIIQHFAGRVAYQIKDFREKNTDNMQPEVLSLLRSSKWAFVHHLVGSSPVAVFRWGVLRATIRILAVLKELGRQRAFLETQFLFIYNGRLLFTAAFLFFLIFHCISLLFSLCLSFSLSVALSLSQNLLLLYFNIGISQNLMNVRSLAHIVALTSHDQTRKSLLCLHQRKKLPSISSQFQASLSNLLETIEKAEPFFICCIRSNAEKKELHFDDELVLQQIKCTSMLEVVHIKKSAYSAKFTFKEFVEKFRMLLPKGAAATPEDITKLFERMDLDQTTYQIGKTKVFLKEKERQLLQDTLNKEVMHHIIVLQRWFRLCLIRMHFLQKKDAAMLIQRYWRTFYHNNQSRAATVIQTAWRTSQKRAQYQCHQEDNKEMPKKHPGRQRYSTCAAQIAVRVRLRKQPKRKRRLAYARSGLMLNFGGSKESEFWSFPLPPISPQGPRMKYSASSVDVRAHISQVKYGNYKNFIFHRLWFLSRILKKRTPRDSQIIDSPSDKEGNQGSERTRRNPTIRISRATRAEQWNASLDREITDTKELRNLDEFLGNQVNELRNRIKELSATESIFLTATMQFRETIKSMYSVPKPQIGYKDLMKGYHNKVNSLAGPKQKIEVKLVVNLFQSVLDGFIRGQMKRVEAEPVKHLMPFLSLQPHSPLDHLFSTYQVNIMQSCDLCGSYIWGMEKAYMCSACKLICHKKCLTKVITDCSTRIPGSLHFGVQVCVLTSKANPVPKVVEMLLMHVELNGLYTEGIYRKSGSACRSRELHQILETYPETACLDNYPIHTITGLVKRWLRELPDPLMTFSLYNDFLHAVELPEKCERIRAVYQKVDELPSANYNTLERLIFHLVKVAREEDHNRMSSNSLAIVFAPCILRSPDADDPFLGMKDVSKTTLCVEILINEQLRRYTEKMQNIQELEYAEALAVNQLRLKRQNTVIEKPSELDVPDQTESDNETEKTLIERIKSIKQEKYVKTIFVPHVLSYFWFVCLSVHPYVHMSIPLL
uniref:Uncharacterized protein n=1 Tax=Myripristis murdjan TaxID=586833 RepID=A0A667YPB8_9TELE